MIAIMWETMIGDSEMEEESYARYGVGTVDLTMPKVFLGPLLQTRGTLTRISCGLVQATITSMYLSSCAIRKHG